MRASDDGFTLLEMTIVVLLIAIITGIAAPPLASALSGTATRSAADKFVAKHSLARSSAVRHGTTARLEIDATNDRIWVEVDTTAGGTGIVDTVGTVLRLAGESVDLTSTKSVLCFDPRGLATRVGGCPAADASITFSRAGESVTLQTTVTGKILR